jgi:hypothetical protein
VTPREEAITMAHGIPWGRLRRLALPLVMAALLSPALLSRHAAAEEQRQGSPLLKLLEAAEARPLYLYDGIRFVELPMADGKATVGLSCERNTWTLFRLERDGRTVYDHINDSAWGYLPAGPIAGSRLCTTPLRVAE